MRPLQPVLHARRRTTAWARLPVVAAVVLVLVTGTGSVGAAQGTAGRTAQPRATVEWGVADPGGLGGLSGIRRFEALVGRRVSIVHGYSGFAHDTFDRRSARAVRQRGGVPMITWEPWDWRAGSHQPRYSLASLIRGDHDAHLRRWGRDLAAHGGPVLLRFAHEMNTPTYPWGEQVNGNRPGEYVAAWRHVRTTVRAAGGTNARWVWAPNVGYPGTVPLSRLYPGDAHVDWVALDGYNGGSALPWGGWKSFEEIFGPSLRELAGITRKPLMISETASAEAGGSKPRWIADFFSSLERYPAIRAFVWFNHDKETDWRVQSSPASLRAFRQGIADPRFTGGRTRIR